MTYGVSACGWCPRPRVSCVPSAEGPAVLLRSTARRPDACQSESDDRQSDRRDQTRVRVCARRGRGGRPWRGTALGAGPAEPGAHRRRSRGVHRRPRAAGTVDASTRARCWVSRRCRCTATCRVASSCSTRWSSGSSTRCRQTRTSSTALSTGGRTTCNASRTGSDGSLWLTRRRSRWSRPARLRRRGCGPRCGACGGSRRSSTVCVQRGSPTPPPSRPTGVHQLPAGPPAARGRLPWRGPGTAGRGGGGHRQEPGRPTRTSDVLRVPLREDHSAVEFEDSLENLLQRLALIRTES